MYFRVRFVFVCYLLRFYRILLMADWLFLNDNDFKTDPRGTSQIIMPPATAEEDRLPRRSENRGFRRNYFSFFGNPLTPNSSKFEISPKFCEAFFNPVKFRQIVIKICSKTREIDSKFAKNDEFGGKFAKIKTKK